MMLILQVLIKIKMREKACLREIDLFTITTDVKTNGGKSYILISSSLNLLYFVFQAIFV